MDSLKTKVIFSGASITNSPWYTWKDFVQARYNISNVINNGYNGVGNEFIVESTIYQCSMNPEAAAFVMLTNFDKWDWFVEDESLANEINAHERHPVRNLSGHPSSTGYWSTGSWFPKYKEYFLENYYSQHYFIKHTVKNLYVLQKFFSDRQIKNLILFDSPIIECAEQTLNSGQSQCLGYVDQDEVLKNWIGLIDWQKIYRPGLIGFCMANGLKWHNQKFKGHPPSSSHLSFAEKHIFPYLDQIFPVKKKNLSHLIPPMDKLWHV